MASLGTLVVHLGLDAKAFQNGLNKASGMISGFARSIATWKLALPAALSGGALALLGKRMVSLAADAEVTAIQMEVLTGSVEAANKVIKQMRQYALKSPFDSQQLINQTKLLLNYGMGVDDAIDSMKMLSEIASGDEQKLDSLALAFGQAAAAGRLMGQDTLQMINAGFNPLQEISKKTGESMIELRKRMEAGLIPFSEVKQAFNDATKAGGRFAGMNERIAETTQGRWMRLQETISNIQRTLGEKMLPTINSVLQKTSEMLDKFVAMPERWQFMGKVMVAAFDVAIEHIKAKWLEALAWMTKELIRAGKEASRFMQPGTWANIGGQAAGLVGDVNQPGGANAQGIDEATKRLQDLLNQFKNFKPPVEPTSEFKGLEPEKFRRLEWLNNQILEEQKLLAKIEQLKASGPLGPVAQDVLAKSQAKMKEFVDERNALLGKKEEPKKQEGGGLAGLWGDTEGIRAGLSQGLKGMFDRTMIRGNAFVGMMENWLGSGQYAPEEPKPQEPVQFAAAMQRGSVEAYSAIVQAMGRTKDPVVKATEKQTKEIVGAIKESKPIFALVEDLFG